MTTGIWNVKPHGPLVSLADNLWIVDGTIRMPPGPLARRMTVVRLESGELAIFSAIALDEREMQQIEQLGPPAFLIVPNPFHKEDAPAWAARFPRIKVLAPQGALEAVKAVMPATPVVHDLRDERVRFITVPGTQDKESALLVASPDGVTLVINDLIGNVKDATGLMRPILSLMGFGGREPQVPRAFLAQVVRDKKAVAEQFRLWADIVDLRRIVISHGAIIEKSPQQVLRTLADRLSSR